MASAAQDPVPDIYIYNEAIYYPTVVIAQERDAEHTAWMSSCPQAVGAQFNLCYWIDVSLRSTGENKIGGIGVVHRPLEQHHPGFLATWRRTSLFVHGVPSHEELRMCAIKEALGMALEHCHSTTDAMPAKVKIFSTDRSLLAMCKEEDPHLHSNRLRGQAVFDARWEVLEAVGEIQGLEAQVEFHWVPGHLGDPGFLQAQDAARAAATGISYRDARNYPPGIPQCLDTARQELQVASMSSTRPTLIRFED